MTERQTTREEHLAWCKGRALEHLPDNPLDAYSSMCADLAHHEETRDHCGIQLGMMMMMGPGIPDMRSFIEGFN